MLRLLIFVLTIFSSSLFLGQNIGLTSAAASTEAAQSEQAAHSAQTVQSSIAVKSVTSNAEQLLLYAPELDRSFCLRLLEYYNKLLQEKQQPYQLQLAEDLNSQPDLILAEGQLMHGFAVQGLLQPAAMAAGDRLPRKFKQSDNLWYGVFYDPAVFLVNHEYSRRVGQQNILGWQDLEHASNLRITLENLSNSSSTQNFLGAMADRMGETTCLNYLWNINRFVDQYAKFPFTPVRMTAVGDADVAITRQSYVFKYLDNKFPAYVVLPQEGTPVNLYCIGLGASCRNNVAAVEFAEWLLAAEESQQLSQQSATGYMFLFPRGMSRGTVAEEKLWLNSSYIAADPKGQLTSRWLDKVRFSK